MTWALLANVAGRVAVIYINQIVEYSTVEEIFYDA